MSRHLSTHNISFTSMHVFLSNLANSQTDTGENIYLLKGDWVGPQPAQTPPRSTKCNSPPINGQCTNFVLFNVAL